MKLILNEIPSLSGALGPSGPVLVRPHPRRESVGKRVILPNLGLLDFNLLQIRRYRRTCSSKQQEMETKIIARWRQACDF